MDPPNTLIIYIFEDNNPINKIDIPFSIYFHWFLLNDLYKYLSVENKKLKYFDEENELISIKTNEDFTIFKELISQKSFINDKVVLICHSGVFNEKKFGRLDKLLKLKIENESFNSFIQIKSVESAPNCHLLDDNVDYDSTTSTSSSSLVVQKRKPTKERNKRHNATPRYSALLKKEINYLPGSEISDGQIIVKKWRIKNVGSKKWKENSVKSVLLPSQYSHWITYSPVKVPICFADQKVDIEMEIHINGQWNVDELNSDECSRNINLTWLLFKDSLVTKSTDNFKEYLLTKLVLSINVKKKFCVTGMNSSTIENKLQKHLSESSIERIDQEFSIVDLSENENKKEGCNKTSNATDTDCKSIGDESEDIELELPECPHGDDFKISDFNKPDSYISVTPEKVIKDEIKSDQSLMVLAPSDYVGNLRSISDEKCVDDRIEKIIADSLVELNKERSFSRTKEEIITIGQNQGNNGILMATNEDEVLNLNEINKEKDIEEPCLIKDQKLLIEVVTLDSKIGKEDEEFSMLREKEEKINIAVDEYLEDKNEKEKTNSKLNHESSDKDEFKDCHDVLSKEIVKIEEEKEEISVAHKDDIKSDLEIHEAIVENPKESVNGALKEPEERVNVNCSGIGYGNYINQQPINNEFHQYIDHTQASRQKPIETIRNDFPRTNFGVIPVTHYVPGNPYPCQPTNYIAGVGRGTTNYYQTPPAAYNHQPAYNQQPAYNPYPVIYPNLYPMPVTQTQVLQGNTNRIVEDLRRNGHLHDHVNEVGDMRRVDNGQPYVTSVNLQELKRMGFLDEERNLRLLNKFNNNMHDVINDLID